MHETAMKIMSGLEKPKCFKESSKNTWSAINYSEKIGILDRRSRLSVKFGWKILTLGILRVGKF